MKLALLTLLILIRFSFCFSQTTSDNLSGSLRSFWANISDTAIKPTFRKFNVKNKQVVFFGTRHNVENVSDSMYIQMAKEIDNLNPTLILTEGYTVLFDNKIETTRMFGDAGFCNYSAYEKGVRVGCWDIPYNDLYYSLRKEFSENELYVLMIITELRRRRDSVESFSDFIDEYEARGWQFRPEQKTVAFFVKQYKRYFDIPLKTTSDYNFQVPQLQDAPRLKKYYSIFQQLREEHLLKTLKESLSVNDRVFIQAGVLHLTSLEKIIPLVLKESKGNNLSEEGTKALINFVPDINFTKAYSIEKIAKNEKTIVLFGSNHNANIDHPQFTAIKKEIANVKPDLILTQGFKPLYASGKQTISESGVAGLCRYLGIAKDTRVNSWDPPWNEVHYMLNKKYKTDDIYFSLLCWTVLNNNIRDLTSIEDLAIETLRSFEFFGYPITLKANVEFDFYKSLAEYLGQPVFGTFATPIPASENPDGSVIEMSSNGSYKFRANQSGIYNYMVPLCTNTQMKDCARVPLQIKVPSSSFVEISGSLPPPATYMSVGDIKEILKKCIRQDIVDDLQSIRAAYLLKQVREYQNQYNRILIQADRECVNFVKAELEKDIR